MVMLFNRLLLKLEKMPEIGTRALGNGHLKGRKAPSKVARQQERRNPTRRFEEKIQPYNDAALDRICTPKLVWAHIMRLVTPCDSSYRFLRHDLSRIAHIQQKLLR